MKPNQQIEHSQSNNSHIPEQNVQLTTVRRKDLSEEQTTVKSQHVEPKRHDAYVSEIINVQSLLNVRTLQPNLRKRNDSKSFNDRIIINVCGDRYETHRTTLELFPNTLLGNRKYRRYYFDKIRNEYFFDRNRTCFEAILYYYQSNGRLRRPNFVPIDIFLDEVTFFQLGPEALKQLRQDENIKEVRKVHLPKSHWRRYLWATMEYPDYSILAKVVNIISLLAILISTMSLAIETLPEYINMTQDHCYLESNITDFTENNQTRHETICYHYFSSPFFIIQSICVAIFAIELVLRIISMPSIKDFVKNTMNWVDIIAVLTYFISIIIHFVGRNTEINTSTYVGLRLIRVLRFVRVFKFYRVFRNIKSLRVLSSTMKQSIPDFLVMIVILTLFSFLFGAAAYFAENETNHSAFDSILKATYWGIITITSVGYGDIYPVTPIGRIIACLCSLVGAAMIGMLVSVLVDRYQRVFTRKLYIEEKIIDFDDYSDDDLNDSDSRIYAGQGRRKTLVKEIEDPDARARANAGYDHDENKIENTLEVPTNPELPPATVKEDIISRKSSRMHFIIGYVDDQTQEASKELLNSISTVIAQRRVSAENIQLNIIADEQPVTTTADAVKFRFSESTDEESDEDDDVEEELTEIKNGSGQKGNVLKKFQCP